MTALLEDWADRLVRLADATLRGPQGSLAGGKDVAAMFRDEFGHRRPEDGPFLAAHAGEPWLGPTPDRPEARLWVLAASGSTVSLHAALGEILGPSDQRGPLLYARRPGAIEAETDAELSALHALWVLAERETAWRERALSAARWCVESLQPDNATNEPWAAHVFLILEAVDRRPEAGLYAQTLLQNAMVGGMQGGRLPRRSAWIARDAGLALRRYLARARPSDERPGP